MCYLSEEPYTLYLAGSAGLLPIHWYIMTSPFTDDATRKFFERHKYFGLEADQVKNMSKYFCYFAFWNSLQLTYLGPLWRSPFFNKALFLVFLGMVDLSWTLHIRYRLFF